MRCFHVARGLLMIVKIVPCDFIRILDAGGIRYQCTYKRGSFSVCSNPGERTWFPMEAPFSNMDSQKGHQIFFPSNSPTSGFPKKLPSSFFAFGSLLPFSVISDALFVCGGGEAFSRKCPNESTGYSFSHFVRHERSRFPEYRKSFVWFAENSRIS